MKNISIIYFPCGAYASLAWWIMRTRTSKAIKNQDKSIGLVNEWYLEDLSENIKSVFRDKKQKGIYVSPFALYGYEKNPNQKGHLIIDEEASKTVKEIFTLFSQGYGKQSIARILNDKGVPSPTQYKKLKGSSYYQPNRTGRGLWQYSTISQMLTNQMYIGNLVQHRYESVSYKSKAKKRVPKEEWIIAQDTHEPIIGKELWETVQELTRQKAKPNKSGKIGVFARKIKCKCCKYTLRSGRKNGKVHYRCLTNLMATGVCTGAYISHDKLEKAVLFELRELISRYINQDELLLKVDINNRH